MEGCKSLGNRNLNEPLDRTDDNLSTRRATVSYDEKREAWKPMMARITPLVLIAAIVVCPLLCRNGQCQGCCAQDVPGTDRQAAPADNCDCCDATCDSAESTSVEYSSDGDGPRPCDPDSDASGCQGICGGAVLGKPDSLPPLAVMWMQHHCADRQLPPTLCLEEGRPPVGAWWSTGDMTPGRYLRTLHMSFLL